MDDDLDKSNSSKSSSSSSGLCKSFEKSFTLEGIYAGGGNIAVFGGKHLVSQYGDEVKWTNHLSNESLFSMQALEEIYSFDVEPYDDATEVADDQGREDVLLALIDRTSTIQLFDTFTGCLVKSFKATSGDSRSVAKILKWYGKGDVMVVGYSDGCVRVFSKNGYLTHDFRSGHGSMITSISVPLQQQDNDVPATFSSSSSSSWLLVTGAADGSICVWDLMQKCLLTKLKSAHSSSVTAIVPFANNSLWLSAARDSVVRVWSAETLASRGKGGKDDSLCVKPVLDHFTSILAVPALSALSSDNDDDDNDDDCGDGSQNLHHYFICGGGDKNKLSIWKYGKADFSKVTRDDIIFGSPIEKMCWICEDEGLFLVALADSSIFFYQVLVNGKKQPVLQRKKTILGNYAEMTDAIFLDDEASEEDRILLTSNDENLRLWDRKRNDWQLIPGHKDMVLCLAKGPKMMDGFSRIIGSGSKDASIRIYACPFNSDSDDHKFECLAEGIGHTAAINALAFHVKGNDHFVASVGADRTLKVWSLKGLESSSKSSKRGNILKLPCNYTVMAHDKEIHSVAVAPNSALIATASQDKTAKIWNRTDGSLVATLKGHKRSVWSVTFSTVDRVVATSSADCKIKIWSCHDFSCLKTFEGHESSVLKLAFINRGLQMASVGSDGLLKLWNLKSSDCINTFDAHDDKIWGFDVRGDGKELLTASTDCSLSFWQDITELVEQEKTEKKNQQVLEEQDLMNEERLGNYGKALMLSFRLQKPQNMFRILDKMLACGSLGSGSGSGSGSVDQQETFNACMEMLFNGELDGNTVNLKRFMYFLLNWTSGSFKNSIVAQRCIFFLWQRISPNDLLATLSSSKKSNRNSSIAPFASAPPNDDEQQGGGDLSNNDNYNIMDIDGHGKRNIMQKPPLKSKYRRSLDEKIPDIGTLLKALLAYSNRHMDHLRNDIGESRHLLDFMVTKNYF